MSAALLLTLLGLTYEPVCPSPGKCAQPVVSGEVVPFDGILLTPQMAVDATQAVDRCEAVAKAEIARVNDLAKIELDAETQRRLVDANAYSAKEAALQAALDAAQPKWYERPLFVAIVTAGAVSLTAVGVAQLVR